MGADPELNDVKVELTTQDSFDIELTFDGLTAAQQQVFEQAADRWEQVVIGDVPDSWYLRGLIPTTVDDLRIDVSFDTIDEGGNGEWNILGQTRVTDRRIGSQLPVRAFIVLDTYDAANMEANGTLSSVALHEMGHALGIGQNWSLLGLLTGTGGDDPRFTGAQATAEYNALFGVSETGVPVEAEGGSGTRLSHWRESTFDSELMTGTSESAPPMPLSRITVASLADIGYRVDMNAADAYTPPAAQIVAGQARGQGQWLVWLEEPARSRGIASRAVTDDSLLDRSFPLFSDVPVILG
jgi:hypothetical protein